jgi:hypothetical protein
MPVDDSTRFLSVYHGEHKISDALWQMQRLFCAEWQFQVVGKSFCKPAFFGMNFGVRCEKISAENVDLVTFYPVLMIGVNRATEEANNYF